MPPPTAPEDEEADEQKVSALNAKEQISYWKSRTFALEYENQMLQQFVENVNDKLDGHEELENLSEPKTLLPEQNLSEDQVWVYAEEQCGEYGEEQCGEYGEEQYVEYVDEQFGEYVNEQFGDYVEEAQAYQEETKQKRKSKVKKKVTEEDLNKLLPKDTWKKKEEEMRELYGDFASRINGMETAVQLNYETYLEKFKPKYWPNVAIKL